VLPEPGASFQSLARTSWALSVTAIGIILGEHFNLKMSAVSFEAPSISLPKVKNT
jgi:hypothetical protein